MKDLVFEIDTGEELDLDVSQSESLEFAVSESFALGGGEKYKGQTVVTPSREEQVLETKGFLLGDNIIVEPIPKNYGLVTWNGVTLTVS